MSLKFSHGPRRTLSILACACACLPHVRAVPPAQLEQKITSLPPVEFGEFGSAVALDGDTALIAARRDDSGFGLFFGSVQVLVREAGSWTLQSALATLADPHPGITFGSAVAIDGDTAVVGAIDSDIGASNAGAVHVFVRSGTTWTQEAVLVASLPSSNERLGSSVAIDGDTIVAGAPSRTSVPNSGGAAYVFTRTSGTWSQQAKLVGFDTEEDDFFGGEVAIDGDSILVGAQFADGSSGSAYSFQRVGGSWLEKDHLVASVRAGNTFFGSALAIEGDEAMIGAYGYDTTPDERNAGAVYVFSRSGSDWTEQAILTAGDPARDQLFGTNLQRDGSRMVVGTLGFHMSWSGIGTVIYHAGKAHVFERNGGAWSELGILEAHDGESEDWFGTNIAIDGDAILVGARRDDNAGLSNTGSAHFFRLPPPLAAWAGPSTDAPELRDGQPEPVEFFSASGLTDVRQLTVANTGTETLHNFTVELSGPNSGEFAVTMAPPKTLPPGEKGLFELTYTPGGAFANASMHIYGDANAGNPFDVPLFGLDSGIFAAPEIELRDGDTLLSDGQSDPVRFDDNSGLPMIRTLEITNTGSAPLRDFTVTLDGLQPTDFEVTEPLASVLVPGATTTFRITYGPPEWTHSRATLHVGSNDSDESPFDLSLYGITPIPEAGEPDLAVFNGPSVSDPEMTSGQNEPVAFEASVTPQVRTLTISNAGDSPLVVDPVVTIVGEDGGDFAASAPALTELPTGTATTLEVTYTPDGIYSIATLHIASNDPDETIFEVRLFGSNTSFPDREPEIAVFDGPDLAGTEYTSGQPAPVVFNQPGRFLDTTRQITVTNTGDNLLEALTVNFAGLHPDEFSATAPDPVLVPGATTTFTVDFGPPKGDGTREALMKIASNDPDENPFVLNLEGPGWTALQSWRFLHFGHIHDAGLAANVADPERDRIANLIEFAFDLHPLQFNPQSALPPLKPVGPDLLGFAFVKPPGVDGVVYGAEGSLDLEHWFDLLDLDPEADGFLFALPTDVEPTQFGRLTVREE